MRMMVRQGVAPLVIGVSIGLIGARMTMEAIEVWLFQVGTNDVAALGLAAVILSAAALVASWIPARRAARVEPIETLRQE